MLVGKLLNVYLDRYGNETLGSSPMSAGDALGSEALSFALEKQSSALKAWDLAAGPYNVGL
ncbi:hypothetical protein OBV_24630 [Oscillibacter valericigenes Sjm18-20]|nr:hypothetical protein OBV_24630 [Oscillibacter valericigenes Sjm18-20]